MVEDEGKNHPGGPGGSRGGDTEWRSHRLVRRVVHAPSSLVNIARRTREIRAPLGMVRREGELKGRRPSFEHQEEVDQAQSRPWPTGR